MANYAIMRFKKLKTKNEIMGALKHAFREIPTPNADASVNNVKFKDMPNQPMKRIKDTKQCFLKSTVKML